MGIRLLRLAVGLALLFPAAGYGDDHTFCMGLECRGGRRLRSEVRIPKTADAEVPVYDGLDCPGGIPLKEPLKTLPRGHAFVGQSRKQVIIPITKPQEQLEDGDILLTSYNLDTSDSPSAQFFGGTGHAALVGTVDGKKRHLDSPPSMSGDFVNELAPSAYTVLRLRQYPPGVNTPADLKKMKEQTPERIEAWTKRRAEILARVKTYFDAMRKHPYTYNANFLDTKVFDKKIRETWREAFFSKDKESGSCPIGSLYCSELPATGFALADEGVAQGLPRGIALLGAIDNFEERIFLPELKKIQPMPQPDSKEWKAVFDRMWDRLVNDVGDGRAEQLADFRRHEGRIKGSVQALLSLPRNNRPAVFALLTAKVSLPITPSDFFQDMFRENGWFSYAGSVVPPNCFPTKLIAAADSPDAGKERDAPSPPDSGLRLDPLELDRIDPRVDPLLRPPVADPLPLPLPPPEPPALPPGLLDLPLQPPPGLGLPGLPPVRRTERDRRPPAAPPPRPRQP